MVVGIDWRQTCGNFLRWCKLYLDLDVGYMSAFIYPNSSNFVIAYLKALYLMYIDFISFKKKPH